MLVKVYDKQAKEIDSLELSDAVFAREYNEAIIHQCVVAQLNNMRQGTKSTLTRTEVRGGGRKPWIRRLTFLLTACLVISRLWMRSNLLRISIISLPIMSGSSMRISTRGKS